MAVVSADHADASLCAENLVAPAGGFKRAACGPRLIAAEDVQQHSGKGTGFWAVIDSFVVDCSEFVDTHPGGLRKLLSADSPATGATGQPFGFSFSRGRNAHFPDTGKRFREGVKVVSARAEAERANPVQVRAPAPPVSRFSRSLAATARGMTIPGHMNPRIAQPLRSPR